MLQDGKIEKFRDGIAFWKNYQHNLQKTALWDHQKTLLKADLMKVDRCTGIIAEKY